MSLTKEQLEQHAKLIAKQAEKDAASAGAKFKTWLAVEGHTLYCGIFIGGAAFGSVIGYLVGSIHH